MLITYFENSRVLCWYIVMLLSEDKFFVINIVESFLHGKIKYYLLKFCFNLIKAWFLV